MLASARSVRRGVQAHPAKIVLALASFALAYLAIDPWHDWGGDFAYYLTIARNEARGHPSAWGVMRIVAPDGFPELLERLGPPVNFRVGPLKLYNLAYLTVYLGAVGAMTRALRGPVAQLCFFAFATVNVWIWFYANRVLTEMPFLALASLILLLGLYAERPVARRPVAAALAMYPLILLGCSLRGAAILLLLLPPVTFAARRERSWIVLGGLGALSAACLASVRSLAFFTPPDLALDLSLAELIVTAFGKLGDELEGFAWMMTGQRAPVLVGVLVAGLAGVGAVRRLMARRWAAPAFIVLASAPMFLVPWTAWGGRYWFGVLPAVALLVTEGLLTLAAVLPRLRAAPLALVTVAAVVSHLTAAGPLVYTERDRGAYSREADLAFTWINENTAWRAPVCMDKPRILAFRANIPVTCGLPGAGTPDVIEAVLEAKGGRGVFRPGAPAETFAYYRARPERVLYDEGGFLVVTPPGVTTIEAGGAP